ncbi:hypothetical protein CB0940_04577 [Cercospora beticola]|uniref:Allergen Asp f 7 n=1 Tax=Cercospora beticola TaxID=122368 RepID=A0A2G5HLH3_CERBT|nr:hypothetical protein CB0940_04577 [Cercospora beticola]PIA93380.1 hypothetical protein CB0940_04577 [Cercospora beticola]WPB01829.1 hypothetical protein RHO25_006461 [Cercospora beticola]CAK1363337.1 unnamed protein product [Cercospora beticola]
MYTNSLLAVTGALLSLAAAVPHADPHRHHHKKDYVYVEHTEVVYETVPVTKTVWVEPGHSVPTPSNPPADKPASYPKPSSPEAPKNKAPAPPAYSAPPPPAYSEPAPPAYSEPAPPAPKPESSPPQYVPPPPPAPTSTSTYVAPPAPTYAPPPVQEAPAPAPAPAPSQESSGSTSGKSSGLSGMASPGKSYTGELTWYDVGLGSCGFTNTKDEHVVAISHEIFDAYSNGNPNKNPLCGCTVTITGKDGSKHQAKVVDRCVGCVAADLDLSQDFFNLVTNNGDGRVGGMEWCFD